MKISQTQIPQRKRYLMEIYIHEWMTKGIKNIIAIMNENSTFNTDFFFVLKRFLFYFILCSSFVEV